MYCRGCSKSLRETVYFTLVRSPLEHSSTIWSPWLYKDKLELEKVQQQAARFVCNNYDPIVIAEKSCSLLLYLSSSNLSLYNYGDQMVAYSSCDGIM